MLGRLFRLLLTIAIIFVVALVINFYVTNLIEKAVESDSTYLSFATKTLFTILYRLIIISIWIVIFIRSENVQSKLAWMLLLLIDPLFATLLFITFGREFKRTYRYKKRVDSQNRNYMVHEPSTDLDDVAYDELDQGIKDIFKTTLGMTGHHIYAKNTSIEVLTNGNEKFPKLLDELRNAKNFIFMDYFIIKTDNIGKEVMEVLRDKAKQGLDVRLLYDYIGGLRANSRYLRGLKKDGVKVVAIDKFFLGALSTKINYRNHRKVTVIDGKKAFVGGLNLGDEYNHNSEKFGFWRDTHLFVEGKLVNSLMSIFAKDWNYATGEFLKSKKYYCADDITSNSYSQVVQSGPDTKLPYIKDAYLKMIHNAQETIKISTPYLVLDSEFRTALKMAALKGVNVEILLPGLPDKKSVYKVTEANMGKLLKFGINVYKYKDTFVHAKVLIVDNKIASCGTFNLDIRSFAINFEATVLLTGDSVDKLTLDFNNDISSKNSVKMDKEEWDKRPAFKKIVESTYDIFSPLM